MAIPALRFLRPDDRKAGPKRLHEQETFGPHLFPSRTVQEPCKFFLIAWIAGLNVTKRWVGHLIALGWTGLFQDLS